MTGLPSNRRGSQRFALPARATVFRRGGEPIPFAVRDLSAGGARLVGHVRLTEAERIQVELDIEGAVVRLWADVVRTDPQNAQVAIAFRDVPRDARKLIERTLAELIERVGVASASHVIVVGAPAESGATLVRDLAQLGRSATSCATMLETMWALQDAGVRHEAIIVHNDVADRFELLQFVGDHHPRLRRILLFGDQMESVDHASSRRVDAVLRTPWRIRPLARALCIASPDSTLAMLPPADAEKPER